MIETGENTTSTGRPTFLVGTSGWTYDHWKGRFYPENLPKKSLFDFYASRFSSVEVNATFYRIFKDETYHKWRERALQGFGYVLKAPRLITHRKYLADVEEDIKSCYRSCTLLGDKFDLILLQVAPNMPVEIERLRKTLLAFPDPGKVAVEFRREERYDPGTLSLLNELGVTFCNVDSPRQSLTDHLTSIKAYLRLHGRKHWYSYNYTDDELREIASLAQELASRGANKVYIFLNNDYNANAPANAIALQGMLGGGKPG
ncbi:MAG: hypothetical protein A2136_07745 [Chloroflexi bacterium RBG_16_54_11]|nr:MAG: hypothetical protein A2136_07745 [Chloroflexi bacterium RBG_16_54_11]